MSDWDYPHWHKATVKKPPPAHGIKMKKVGTTWWSQRWIEALERVLQGDAARLARGRTYARAGRAHDLVFKDSKVSAKVTGSRATPYKITIALTALPEAVWSQAMTGMASRAQLAAELLAGNMPRDIDDIFVAAGASLFPVTRKDLVTTCSCPDWGDPCKHVAATHYVLGEALEADPFLLFELRGRTKAQLLDGLRKARSATQAPAAKPSPTKTIKRTKAKNNAEGSAQLAYDQPREPLPTLHFSFDVPATHAAALRQLGVPRAWNGAASPVDLFASRIRAAAEGARSIAMAEPLAEQPSPSRALDLKSCR